MRRLTGLLAVCLVALSTASSDATASTPSFRDVPTASPHVESIAALAEAGITSGCAVDQYCPRQPVTRDQMASFLARALELDPVPGGQGFQDVTPGSVHAGAIGALERSGITTGCAEGRYCPRQRVTRDQMASFLTRALGLPPGGDNRFPDVAPSSPHAGSVNALAAAGVTAGCAADRFCPRQAVTRDQMASFLARALGLVGPPGLSVPPPSTGPAPDDAVLAFVREPLSGCTGPCAEHTAIWTVRVDGGSAVAATNPSGAFDRHPRWAPDGSALAFVRIPRGAVAGEVHVADVRDGRFTDARRVTSTSAAHGGQGCQGESMAPTWSPDSSRLAMTCATSTEQDAASHVLVVGADGAGQFSVPTGTQTADARPTWSPDGGQLAFARTDQAVAFGMPQRVQIWTADVGGPGASNVRALSRQAQAAQHPQWSPAGGRILYVSVDESVLRPSLRTVRTAGGPSSTIYTSPRTEAVQLYAPAWSPAGEHIAIPVGDGLKSSVVHVVAAVGGSALAVSPTDALAFAPAWGPTGHLAFDVVAPSRSGASTHQLATAAADATGYRTVAVDGAFAYDAQWYPRGGFQ